MRALSRQLLLVLSSTTLVLSACSSDSENTDMGTTMADLGQSTPDSGQTIADMGTTADAGTPDSGETADAGMPDAGGHTPSPKCMEMELKSIPMKEGSETFNFGDVAGDFTVNTIAGSWNFKENWTGCDSYIFIPYIPTSSDYEETLWGSSINRLVEETQLNHHIFFGSIERLKPDRMARVEAIKAKIEQRINRVYRQDVDLVLKHRARFHYITDTMTAASGSLGEFLTDYLNYTQDPTARVDLGDRGQAPPPLPFAFGIDRDQKWDSVGNLNRTVGGAAALDMISYVPDFYDFKAKIRDNQADESGVTTISLLEGSVTDRIIDVDAMLPTAAQIEGFDTMEFDVSVNCPHRNVFACSEWDRIARILVCMDSMCETRREIIRWITPYWRRGERRWIIDASALMGMVKDGGMQRFRIEMGPRWERKTPRDVRVNLRFRQQNSGMRAVGWTRTSTGGSFNANYNAWRTPISFNPPATAKKVELVVILSGHGQQQGNNCAEWCDHRHQFAINGTNLDEIRHTGQVGSSAGCGPATKQGLPPGQFGNWAPERAYWCPGLPVDHMRFDITSQVNLGQANTLTYQGNYRGAEPQGGGIDLSSYVVWYE